MTRILTAADVAAVLGPEDCFRAVENAFREYGEGRLPPPRTLGVDADGGSFHVKAALTDVFAAKVNANFPSNPNRHALPTIQGLIVIFDRERGTPLAVLDSAHITALRTAAATAVAVSYLARADASALAVIGCGLQGGAHVDALVRVRRIERVVAYDADPERARAFVGEVGARLGRPVDVAASLDAAVAEADVVVTCTPARAPILDLRHLRPGLFVAGVGADHPDKNELAPSLLAASRVVPDLLDQAAAMGDLRHAIAAGRMVRADVHGELPDVVCGRVPGRESDEDVFVFDSTGTALQDVAAASIAFARAIERGVGVEIDFGGPRATRFSGPRAAPIQGG